MESATNSIFPIGVVLVVLSAGCGTTVQEKAGAGGGEIDGGAPADAGAGACSGSSLRPGNTTAMLQHGGSAREYIVHVPPSYDGNSPVPLVLDIHGLTSNAFQQ